MIRQAVILCGGRGTRLLPLTASIPKVLLPVGGHSILEDQMHSLKAAGVSSVVLCTGHLGEAIEAAFGDGARVGLAVRYAREEAPLGTAGAIADATALLKDNFYVLYGDVFFRMDLAKLGRFHLDRKAAATCVVHPSSHLEDSDIAVLGDDDRIADFARRTPRPNEQPLGNAALLVLNRSFLGMIPAKRPVDFSRDVFPEAVRRVPCFGYRTDEYILDVGTRERYEQLLRDRETRAFTP